MNEIPFRPSHVVSVAAEEIHARKLTLAQWRGYNNHYQHPRGLGLTGDRAVRYGSRTLPLFNDTQLREAWAEADALEMRGQDGAAGPLR